VLVIDDSALVREAAKVALAGWQVLVAESGEDGLDVAARERPDAILLDLIMPGIDGIAVAERLRELPATSATPVVFLTGESGPADRERYERVAAVGVIAKPFEIEALAAELAALLGWQR
jgi:CheY-like chemotaxis protein